jgi:transposase
MELCKLYEYGCTMKLPNKYRPVDVSKKYRIRYRLETGRSESYNWHSHVRWYPAGWKINQQTLGRIFSRLHYLGCHAPSPVQKKWRIVYNRFEEKYFATKGKASQRYLNNYTAYKWL